MYELSGVVYENVKQQGNALQARMKQFDEVIN